jgi:hypothetical protein
MDHSKKNRLTFFSTHFNFFFRHKLTIYKLHPDDSGKYFCRVNDIETSAWLEVARKKI